MPRNIPVPSPGSGARLGDARAPSNPRWAVHRVLVAWVARRRDQLHNILHNILVEIVRSRCYGAGMEQVVSSANLRRHPGECIARAAKGETFVVLRYGHAIAMLRPRSIGEAYEPLRATDLWRDFPRVLARARREAVLITWYSEAVAVLGPVSKGWRRGDES
jgi:antitoxin (DNA-binding transcriptional repressor) of toxin-antitoxin stability system